MIETCVPAGHVPPAVPTSTDTRYAVAAVPTVTATLRGVKPRSCRQYTPVVGCPSIVPAMPFDLALSTEPSALTCPNATAVPAAPAGPAAPVGPRSPAGPCGPRGS